MGRREQGVVRLRQSAQNTTFTEGDADDLMADGIGPAAIFPRAL
tara:strand:+ start:18644 stop:18775 length:132 start_codon:yes stop_codon:yes gene_type:complete